MAEVPDRDLSLLLDMLLASRDPLEFIREVAAFSRSR